MMFRLPDCFIIMDKRMRLMNQNSSCSVAWKNKAYLIRLKQVMGMETAWALFFRPLATDYMLQRKIYFLKPGRWRK